MGVSFQGREVMVAISHVTVMTRQVYAVMRGSEAAEVAAKLLNKHRGKIIIGGFDSHCERLQGVFLKLLAFQHLLQNYDYAGTVRVAQACSPSRAGHEVAHAFVASHRPWLRVPQLVLVQRTQTTQRRKKDYIKSSREIRALVDSINQQFGPVVDYEEQPKYALPYRIGMFYACNLLLQTPIREVRPLSAAQRAHGKCVRGLTFGAPLRWLVARGRV